MLVALTVQSKRQFCQNSFEDEDTSWILACGSDDGDEFTAECLLAGGRKELNPRDPQWQEAEGKKKMQAGVMKEYSNVVHEKQALRPLSLEESRRVMRESPERLVESRYVLTEKVEETGETIVKGRWTARGDKDPDLFELVREGKTQSPTISSNGRFAVLQCIASCQFQLQLGDVTGAFLEGDQIERKRGPLYLKQPRNAEFTGVHPEVLFEVVKPLYGFNDSPQLWFCKFVQTLRKQNWRQSVLDPCVFYWRDHLQPHGIGGVLGVHVDDVLTGGKGKPYEEAIRLLRETFPFRKWKYDEGTFCGSSLKQDPKTKDITVSQAEFIAEMKKPQLRSKDPGTVQANAAEIKSLPSVLGAALWVAKETRPDLAVQVSMGQQMFPTPTLEQARTVAHTVKRAKQHADLQWVIQAVPISKLRICLHTDAAFANAKKGGTQAGYLVGITTDALEDGRTAPWTPAAWKSYRLKRVVGSTFAGETQVLADGLGHAEWLACHLVEMIDGVINLGKRHEVLHRFSIQAVVDCKSVYDHLQTFSSPNSVGDKRVAIDLVIIRESIRRIGGRVRWAPTWLQLADALTKENPEAMDLLRAAMRSGRYQLSKESSMMEAAAAERAKRQARTEGQKQAARKAYLARPPQAVLAVTAIGGPDMVKVTTHGFAEVEIRAFFEKLAEAIAGNEGEFRRMLTQSASQCRMKMALGQVQEKTYKGLSSEVTFTFTKNTAAIQIQTGAAYIDQVTKILEMVLGVYKKMLSNEEVEPLPDGMRWWSTAVRAVMAEGGAVSAYLDAQAQVKEKETLGASSARPAVPNSEEFRAAVADLTNVAGLKLHNFPGWRDKLLKYLMEEFDADAGQVVAMADLTEKFNLATDDESGEWVDECEVAAKPKSKAKAGYARDVYSPGRA